MRFAHVIDPAWQASIRVLAVLNMFDKKPAIYSGRQSCINSCFCVLTAFGHFRAFWHVKLMSSELLALKHRGVSGEPRLVRPCRKAEGLGARAMLHLGVNASGRHKVFERSLPFIELQVSMQCSS